MKKPTEKRRISYPVLTKIRGSGQIRMQISEEKIETPRYHSTFDKMKKLCYFSLVICTKITTRKGKFL